MSVKRYWLSMLIAATLSIAVHAEVVQQNFPGISYVKFESFDPRTPTEPLTVSGQLRIPTVLNEDGSLKKVPAVVMLHGSAGVDSRGQLYAEALNDAGIATFEIDMWGARGISGGFDRPALPTLTMPDAFRALKYLSEDPRIDADRIGVIGFSWGGVMTMLAATQQYTFLYGEGLTFAAYVAHYPICWAYNIGIPGADFNNLTGNPLLIEVGDSDDYDEGGGPCQNLVASLTPEEQAIASVNVYSNSEHAWDRLQPAIVVPDPFSHLGAGGDVLIAPNPGQAFKARANVVEFFKQNLGLAN